MQNFMTPTQRLATLAAASLLLGALTACSQDSNRAFDEGPQSSQPGRVSVDPSIFERAGHGNFLSFDTPVEMARNSDVAISGRVVGFSDGYEVVQHGSKEEGYDIHDYNVVMEVEITSFYKGPEELEKAGSVFLTLPRGAEQEGIPDDGGPSTVTPVRAYEEAIPEGSEVVVIASPDVVPEGPSLEVIGQERGRPSGASLMSGWHPQSLSFAVSDGGTTGWSDRSIAEIERELDNQF